MKSAHDIFLTVGVPIPLRGSAPSLRGFRAFNEHDIGQIQADALRGAISLIAVDGNPQAAIDKIENLARTVA